MNQIRIGIDVSDKEYADRLVEVVDKKYANEYQVCCFQEKAGMQAVHFWITDGMHLQTLKEMNQQIILMADKQDALNIQWQGERIDPYIAVNKMMKQLRSCIKRIQKEKDKRDYEYSDNDSSSETAVNDKKEQRGVLISIYSPIGGCGKSTLAMTVSKCIAETVPGARVLHLNLEGTSDWPLFFASQREYNLSDFLYNMLLEKTDRNTTGNAIFDIVTRQESGVFFVEPCNTFEDLNVLEESEILQLLTILQNQFDYIVCDMNTAFYSVNKLIFRKSRMRFLISNGTVQGRCKIEKYKEELRHQHLLDEIMSMGMYMVQIGNGGKSRERNKEYRELPLQKEMFAEKNGLLCLRSNTEWYRKVKMMMEEVMIYGRT